MYFHSRFDEPGKTMLRYISHIPRAYSSFIKFKSSVDVAVDLDMFNRNREIECLSRLLVDKPQFSILTGPVDSGKTRLVERLLQELPSKSTHPMPICSLNLRKGTFYTVRSLVESLSIDMGTWLHRVWKSMDFEISAGQDESVSLQLSSRRNTSPTDSLNILLKQVANGLPSRTLLRGKQCPVLFVDEANRLRTVLRDSDGQSALESFFEWLILHTKEKQQFHVLMASSDSFFNRWVEKYIGSSRYVTYVLGHLDRNEAKKYWEMILLSEYEGFLKKANLALPKYDDVYSVCGGSMFLMDRFIREYCEQKGGGLIGSDPNNFSMVIQEQRRLMRALSPVKTFQENDPPKWCRNELINLMKMMIDESGIINYDTVCEKLGISVINSLIEYNIVHLRPTSSLSYDVPMHDTPVITAESPASFAAMKKLLKCVSS